MSNFFTPAAPLQTAVLFLVFNRPNVTAQVFEAIRQAKPPRLYVAADGPRANKLGEAERCEEVRRIATNVDWPCQVKTLFREVNQGCRMGVSGGINWFFEHEEEGIILEDDCLPVLSFFWFCEELLNRYRNDTRIWQISGSSFFPEAITPTESDYFFSRYGPIWGWASWRRAWKAYDPDLKSWDYMELPNVIDNIYSDKREKNIKKILGRKLFNKEIDTWDYQWGFIKNYNHSLTAIPKVNQIINIGFNEDATHTLNIDHNAPTLSDAIQQPYKHPRYIYEDLAYSNYFLARVFHKSRLKAILKRIFLKK